MRDCARLIIEAHDALQLEPYGVLPTLHAHTLVVNNTLAILTALRNMQASEMRSSACDRLFWTVLGMIERFRDALARLRVDPEASIADPMISLSMLVQVIHFLGSREPWTIQE